MLHILLSSGVYKATNNTELKSVTLRGP